MSNDSQTIQFPDQFKRPCALLHYSTSRLFVGPIIKCSDRQVLNTSINGTTNQAVQARVLLLQTPRCHQCSGPRHHAQPARS